MNLTIEKPRKRRVKEPRMWNEKKEAPEGAFFTTYFHSITPTDKKQGRK